MHAVAGRLLDGISYNQLVEKLVSEQDSSEVSLLKEFLDSNASQLTKRGLTELLANLDDSEIAVLFRNNHFHTLAKHKVTRCIIMA